MVCATRVMVVIMTSTLLLVFVMVMGGMLVRVNGVGDRGGMGGVCHQGY